MIPVKKQDSPGGEFGPGTQSAVRHLHKLGLSQPARHIPPIAEAVTIMSSLTLCHSHTSSPPSGLRLKP